MKNLTISLTEELAHRAKVFAAEQNTSVSRYVGLLLTEKLEAEAGYRSAMQDWCSVKPSRLNESGDIYPSRESLYER